MNKKLKSVPKFRSEAEGRRFWQTHNSSDYIDWAGFVAWSGRKAGVELFSWCRFRSRTPGTPFSSMNSTTT
jgi:hypothetical protein